MTADVDIMPHILTFLVVSQQIGPASQNFFPFDKAAKTGLTTVSDKITLL